MRLGENKSWVLSVSACPNSSNGLHPSISQRHQAEKKQVPDPIHVIVGRQRLDVLVQCLGNFRRGSRPVAEVQNPRRQLVNEQRIAPLAVGLSKGGDMA